MSAAVFRCQYRRGKRIGKVFAVVFAVDCRSSMHMQIIVFPRQPRPFVIQVKEHKHTQMRRIDLDVAAFDGGSVRAHQHRRFFEIFAVWLVWDTFLQEEVGLGV